MKDLPNIGDWVFIVKSNKIQDKTLNLKKVLEKEVFLGK